MPKGWFGAALLCLCTPWLWFYWGSGPAIILAILGFVFYWRKRLVLAGLMALLVVLILRLEVERSHSLARDWQHQTIPMVLCVKAPARQYEHYQVLVTQVVSQPEALSLRQVRVTLPAYQRAHPGDCLSGQWRVRQPVGQLIPGQFNQTRYYFTERIDALATLVELDRLTTRPSVASRLYQRVSSRFEHDQVRAVWAALALGWGSALPGALAELFNQAQVRHLLVVSGMHVGMVAAWLWLLLTLVHRTGLFGPVSLIWLRCLTVMGGAGGYVALTGFGYPGIRAWIMMSAPLILLALGLKLGRYTLLAIAATALALYQPQAWLAAGAWLSFGLVWILLSQANRWRDQGMPNWQLALYSQLGISLFMVPVSILFGFYLHPLGVLINLVMIPLVTLIILPWSLLILLLGEWGFISLYETLVQQGLVVLSWVANGYLESPSLSWPLWGLLCSGLLVLLSQVFQTEQRWLFGVMTLLVFWSALRPSQMTSEFRMTLFDVGHGQAVLLQWPGEAWLYDAAAQWGEQSLAQRRLRPWFQRHRIELDGLVISHSDLDHAGGAGWFARTWPNASRWSGEPEVLSKQTQLNGWQDCHQGMASATDRFTAIPIPTALRRDANDRSCLVWIPTSAGPVLLTGDASRFIEYWLLQEMPERFPLALHLLGHHGSPTSSAQAFFAANPKAMLAVSGADRARPRWPSEALQRWLNRHNRPLYNTAELGTLQFRIHQGEIEVKHWASDFRLKLLQVQGE